MKTRVGIAFLTLLLSCAAASAQHSQSPDSTAPAHLFEGMGSLHHPIATSNPEAQRFFDQGLTLIYAFNHDEAARSFRRAAELDPKSPMPWWGLALALGPNYNLDVDPEREKAAFNAIQKAQSLAASGAESERAYVDALATRYSADPKADLKKLANDYAAAMGQLAKRFPDDPDASTIYAESLMDLNPWGLWKLDGSPADHTLDIIAALESVLSRFPEHVGANHYYIHAVEASPHAAWALPSAKRLETLVPNGGHLVHMPAHIYSRVGEFDAAVRSNEAASAVDVAYIQKTGAQGVYPAMYYSHNLHFLAYAAMQEGNFAKALRAADKLAENVHSHGQGMPEFMTAGFSAFHMEVLARFGHWTEILALPQPDESSIQLAKTWRYARCLAFTGKGQLDAASKEQQAFEVGLDKIPPDLPAGFNTAQNLLSLADAALSARIAEARGDRKSAIESWRKAVAIQDQFAYDEPPDWYYPARESLGGTLLRDGQFAAAEKVFREDLAANPRNARSLFGLWKSLEAQQKKAGADWARAEFESAWKDSDSKLRVEDL